MPTHLLRKLSIFLMTSLSPRLAASKGAMLDSIGGGDRRNSSFGSSHSFRNGNAYLPRYPMYLDTCNLQLRPRQLQVWM
ncbi:uncharacterized protein F4817DRAFT_348824 [Daldinia loculata]|uniref:uncharacterized protein n=1 Tax=Daldinia loculata TaxID=103429 RepID=UPI0020C478B4|nr:uncharacterized protein F4817DRAFT_348824 [Daldinia loculata]KAI1643735.1 hypothetical protein F4817DRAFT_348824 [Daldinia loculata]